jgi:type IV pilus assembly protein PilQ
MTSLPQARSLPGQRRWRRARHSTPHRRLPRAAAVHLICALLAGGVQLALAQDPPAASTATPVHLAPLPDEARFDTPVSLRTGPEGEELGAMLQALARSVGLTAIVQGVPDTVVRYDIGEPKPFREIWEIVLSLNGLEYVLRDPDIVVIGPPPLLAGLFETRPTERETREVRTYTVTSSPEQFAALLAAQFPTENVEVTAFEELGLISVRGTPAQQERVAELLERFDRRPATAVRRAYALSHARAEELAAVLQATALSGGESGALDTQSQPGDDQARRLSLPTTLPSDIVIAADARTNRLIVTAPETVQAEIAELIAELDRPERQVNIQVRIQEVRTDAAERLGLNLSAGLDRFAATLFSGDTQSGLSFVFDAQRAISGFNIGAILDVFENQGLSRRVDDSNLTVLNNGTATLQSGGTIFISIAGGSENIERTIPYGVQLDLTPQIANNDEVILDVSGRVEAVLSEATDPAFLELSTRSITSRVTLAPGQTVVLGGLIQNQLTESTRSVPGLSDVPLVGGLFSSSSATEMTTELLVIVTANVLE